MDYLLDILTALGVAVAAGATPWLPLLVTAAAALANLGVDFEGTPFRFVESPVVLVVSAVLAVASLVAHRRLVGPALRAATLGAGALVGAVLAAAVVADRSAAWWPGLVVGALAAILAGVAVGALVDRTRTRLEATAKAGERDDGPVVTLLVVVALAAAAVAALSILLPPVGAVALVAALFLLLGGRRQAGRKHAGLRVLR